MSLAAVSQALTEAEKKELAHVVFELDKRKYWQPLEFLELLPIQKLFRDCTANTILLFGGNRSGKTTPVAARMIESSLEYKKKIWVCGETFQDSIAIQQKKMWELCPKAQIKYGRYDDINGFTNRKLQFKNGTLITFKSYDQGREAFQSDDIDEIWCDEEPPLEIIKEMKMRLIDRNGRLVISMTALKGITDLIADLFEDHDVLESRYAPMVKKTLPVVAEKQGVKIFFLWTTDNDHINQGRLLEEAKLMTEPEILSRIYGLPTNLSGKIYMSFNRRIHVISIENVPLAGNQLITVLDPHDRKPWAIAWFLVNRNGSFYCVDEYPNRNFNEMLYDDKTYGEYAAIIKAKEEAIKQMFSCGAARRVIDPNFGNKTVQLAERQGGQSKTTPKKELEKYGLKFTDGIDALEAGHLKVREFLHYLQRDGQFVVSPLLYVCDNCFNTITHLSRYSRKDITAADGDVKDKAAPMDKYKDFSDCVRYFAMSNPRYMQPKVFNDQLQKTY